MDSRTKKAEYYFANEWKWEWHITLNLKRKYCDEALKAFRIKLQIDEGLQIAYMGFYVQEPNRHLHIIAFGKNKYGQTLLNCNPEKWERHWSDVNHVSAKIKEIVCKEDQQRIVSYIIDRNTPRGNHEKLTPYNGKLLKRYRIL